MGLNSLGLRIRAILFYTFATDMKKWSIIVIISLIITGCEKAIDFTLENSDPKLVVEATIENGQAPIVVLSQSLNYFSTIDPQLLASSFVHNADVSVSNGLQTHKLKEYTYVVSNDYKIYYYSIDSSNLASAFVGEIKQQYSLRIAYQSKEYTATTTIPGVTKRVDSLWWKQAPANNDTNLVVAVVRVTDPPGFGDYARYFTKRNSEPFYPPMTSAFDDLVIDGTTYELQVDPGINKNIERTEEEHFFNKGDTVTFKLCNVDKTTFDFWRTMEYSYSSIGNPFATPVKVLSNISNGALGYFGGYAAQYHTLIIPR
jgi:hypothetical protein